MSLFPENLRQEFRKDAPKRTDWAFIEADDSRKLVLLKNQLDAMEEQLTLIADSVGKLANRM
jgi:hypothetical protein